mmetsp:Transcript_72328/g.212258  ORF Transcript_72328/g.212258 Transcript_72328/m.212258 type:complete len:220 (-) Transcript_72328:78-737(-)
MTRERRDLRPRGDHAPRGADPRPLGTRKSPFAPCARALPSHARGRGRAARGDDGRGARAPACGGRPPLLRGLHHALHPLHVLGVRRLGLREFREGGLQLGPEERAALRLPAVHEHLPLHEGLSQLLLHVAHLHARRLLAGLLRTSSSALLGLLPPVILLAEPVPDAVADAHAHADHPERGQRDGARDEVDGAADSEGGQQPLRAASIATCLRGGPCGHR